jgi:DnaJ-class molecular chaperone
MMPQFNILKISKDATAEEAKQAYHEAARKNHPDLFPPEERQQQHLMMMKINEAYMTIMDNITNRPESEEKGGDINENRQKPIFQQNTITGNELGNLKDPAYTYYKQGFNHYTQGQSEFHKRFTRNSVGKIKSILHPTNKQLLQMALSALRHFEKSYSYFMNVTNNYPNSMWADDAKEKLTELEKLNTVYIKICENIT